MLFSARKLAYAKILGSFLLLVVALSLLPTAAASPSQVSMVLAFSQDQYKQLGYFIAAAISTTGISVSPQPLPWPAVYSRVFIPPEPNYTLGGYDSYLFINPMTPLPNPSAAPYLLINASAVTSNLTLYARTGNPVYLERADEIIYSENYEIPLFYIRPLWAASPELKGFNPTSSTYYMNPYLWSGFNNLTYLVKGSAPSTVLPMFGSSGLPADAVFQPLVSPTENGYSPCLAVNWSHDSNYTVWHVYLRQGVKFQNGLNMTSNDVLWSIKTAMDPLSGSPLIPYFDRVLGKSVEFVLSNGSTYYSNNTPVVGEVKALNDYELEFKLPAPYALFYPVFMSQIFVYPMSALQRIGDLNLAGSAFATGSSTVGTGPYVISSIKNNVYVLKAFPGYWNGSPAVKLLTVNYSSISALSALKLLQVGKVQLVSYNFWLYQFYRESGPWLNWLVGQPSIYSALLLNQNSPYWGTGASLPEAKLNPLMRLQLAADLRDALSLSIPRQYFATALFSGLAIPASYALTPVQAKYIGVSLPPAPQFNTTGVSYLMSSLGYGKVNASYSLAFSMSPLSMAQGKPLTVYGYVLNNGKPLSGVTVDVNLGKPFKTLLTLKSNSEGMFNDSILLGSGTYYVQLSYPGGLTPYGLIPPLTSATQGPVSVVNFWESNLIYFAVLALFVALIIVVAYRYTHKEGQGV
ncbi:MAG: ABC transporter substrate-binding protein [Thermoprotei archaeon]